MIRGTFQFSGVTVHERTIEAKSLEGLSTALLEMKEDSNAFLTTKMAEQKEKTTASKKNKKPPKQTGQMNIDSVLVIACIIPFYIQLAQDTTGKKQKKM
eukprot:jgi/Bigna1/132346/aug1.17_g7054